MSNMFSGKINYMLLCKHIIDRISRLPCNECIASKAEASENCNYVPLVHDA